MKIDPSLIQLFHAVAVAPDDVRIDPREVNRMAMPAGYIVAPEACTPEVFEAMKGLRVNYNTTFYASFKDVESRTRLDQLIDQLLHYQSTYGSDFTAPAFTLNPTPEAMLYKELTPLRAVTEEEMFGLCVDMLRSGVALKNDTLDTLCEYIRTYLDAPVHKAERDAFDIAALPSREGRCKLYAALGILPDEPVEFLRVAVCAATGSAMLINSRQALRQIELCAGDSYPCLRMFGKEMTAERIEALAGIFFRFRHIFIAFKRSFSKAACCSPLAANGLKLINRLRRLAPKFKQRFRADVLSRILDPEYTEEAIRRAVAAEPSAFRLIRLLGYLQTAGAADKDAAMYIIRNGHTFVKATRPTPERNVEAIRRIVEDELTRRRLAHISSKRIRFPEGLELAAPVSEKSFVGNIPLLSAYSLGDSAFIGIYWRNEWGTHDFDLSAIFPDESIKIGWNGDFSDTEASVVFSGDMTDANPEASEILLFRRGTPDGYIFVNRYFGEEGSKYRLFFGQGEPRFGADEDVKSCRGAAYAVRAMDIRIEADAVSGKAREQLTGYIEDGNYHFMNLGIGRNTVSYEAREYPLQKALSSRARTAVSLRELLTKAGAVEITDPTAEVDLDLSPRTLTRDTLIKLFNNEL